MGREKIVQTLRSVCENSLGGGRVVCASSEDGIAVFDAPAWSSAHTDALRAKYGNVRVDVEQSRHSASGFVVLVTPTPRCSAPAYLLLLMGILCVTGTAAFIWNVLHVHFESIHNIELFACNVPAPESDGNVVRGSGSQSLSGEAFADLRATVDDTHTQSTSHKVRDTLSFF